MWDSISEVSLQKTVATFLTTEADTDNMKQKRLHAACLLELELPKVQRTKCLFKIQIYLNQVPLGKPKVDSMYTWKLSVLNEFFS